MPAHAESFNLAGADAPENVDGARVGADYFAMLGVRPALGRSFLAEEDAPGRGDVVILSDGLWRRRFGADPGVLGREVRLDGRPHRVIGVMPAQMDYTVFDEELWVPTAFSAERLAMHDEHYLTVLARLKPGVTLRQATAELETLGRWLATTYPHGEHRPRPVHGAVHGGAGAGLPARGSSCCWAPSGFVLLIACANIANLLLARGAARSREMAIRAAIGAGRGHLLRQALTESLVLAVAGGVLGLLAGYWGVSLLAAFGPEDVPRLSQARVDGPVAGVRARAHAAERAGVRTRARAAHRGDGCRTRRSRRAAGAARRSGSRDRLRNVLVVGEIALALVLLTGAGLLIRSAIALNNVNPGFDPRGVVAGRVSLPETAYQSPEQVIARVRAHRGAARGGAGCRRPARWSPRRRSRAATATASSPRAGRSTSPPRSTRMMRLVTPGYFATMRIDLVRGRTFTADDRRGAPLVDGDQRDAGPRGVPRSGPDRQADRVLRAGARRLAQLEGSRRRRAATCGPQGLDEEPEPEFYLPMVQAPDAAWTWTDRTMTWPSRAARGCRVSSWRPLRRAVAEVDPSLPLYNLGTMQGRLLDSLAQSRFSTMLLTAFGAHRAHPRGDRRVRRHLVRRDPAHPGDRDPHGARRPPHRRAGASSCATGRRSPAVGLAVGLAGALAAVRPPRRVCSTR